MATKYKLTDEYINYCDIVLYRITRGLCSWKSW